MTTSTTVNGIVRSAIPARIDRLPWSSFHTRMVIALGACWILDGFEVALFENISTLKFGLSQTGVDVLASVYLLGEVFGALYFGARSDRLGRRRLFFLTLTIYFIGSFLTVFVIGSGAFALTFLYLTRFVAGVGIGGEYTAINSMIDELTPASYRGRVDIAVNGTFWAGAAVAGAVQIPLLSPAIDANYGWRIALLLGPLFAIVIMFLRRRVPESPRWQIIHGHVHDAERSITDIEREVKQAGKSLPAVDDSRAIDIRPSPHAGYLTLLRVLFQTYPTRLVLGVTMMVTQAFIFNVTFFNYTSVFKGMLDVDKNGAAIYIIPFAIGNLLGALILGRLFDKIGRRKMISQTYLVSGVLLIGSAFMFRAGSFTPNTLTLALFVTFFFASAGAGAAYLTVSEIFPMEVRAKAIGVFVAIEQICSVIALPFYGSLISTHIFVVFLISAVVMITGGLVSVVLAVDAENKSLEDVALPLSVVTTTTET